MACGIQWRKLFLLGSLLALSACNDSSVSSRDIITPTYLFYTSGDTSAPDLALYAVDPADPANPTEVVAPAAMLAHRPIFFLAGTVEQSRDTIADLHYKYLVYPGGIGGNFLIRLNAERSQSLTAQRMSSETQAGAICGILGGTTTMGLGFDDYADPENSVLFYIKDPVDAPACTSDTDDVLFMVRMGMSSGTAPLGGLTDFQPVAPSYSQDGSIGGFLLYNGSSNTIELRDTSLVFLSTKLSTVLTGAFALAVDTQGRTLLLVDNTDLHIFDPATGNISTSLYTQQTSINPLSVIVNNGYVYFQDDDEIWRLPMSGNTIAAVVADESAGTGSIYSFFQVSSGKLIYWYDDSGGAPSQETLRTVPVSGGTPSILHTISGNADIRSIRAAAGRVYLSLGSPIRRAVSVNDDGSKLVVEDYAQWSGFTYHPRQPLFADVDLVGRQGTGFAMARMSPNVIFRIQYSTTGGGNSYSSFDADTSEKLVDYDVPVVDFGNFGTGGFGGTFPPVVHGLATNNQTLVFFANSIGNKDAIFLHARNGRSVVRVTNYNTGTDDADYYGIIGGCALGKNMFDPLFPLMLILSALYLWIRRNTKLSLSTE